MTNTHFPASSLSTAAVRHPLRPYPSNSPRAKARLMVLAMLADGHLDQREMASLHRRGVYADLGIGREDFVEVLHDFCRDVAGRLLVEAGCYKLPPAALAGLFAEIGDRRAREQLVAHMFAVISSDGRISEAESKLLLGAIEQWKLQGSGMLEGNGSTLSARG